MMLLPDPLPPSAAAEHGNSSHDRLRTVLKTYFGYTAFRPHQEEIIQATLAKHDIFALLPTGGGKSLCYQLPALVNQGLTIVISPLIALMKDQVDALQAAGIPGTFLNSTLGPDEARARLRRVESGELRLLYMAPERLFSEGFLSRMREWPIERFAIDEAHCISEWGHDFRPEYRRLGEVRQHFPDVPIMALTATATERVRGDIVHHLKLRAPKTCIASFNRPNLTYRVIEKTKPNEQALRFIRKQQEDSGIVYCTSRKSTEALAEFLQQAGIAAAAYHAGLDNEKRSRVHEDFLRDNIRVVCATTAFGMGVNKPNVRFVLHYDLPKSIEGYYQETGRAGRDGLPGDCLLLFGRGDVAKIARQLEEKPDGDERRHAFDALARMVHYAEGMYCRRRSVLAYFGEHIPDEPCGGCDVCLEPPEEFDATVAAQKLLSCVARIRQASGFAVGMRHIVDVLCGKVTEKISRFGHESLSTFGIGRELSRREWEHIARELTARGFLFSSQSAFPTLTMTQAGREALTARRTITLARRSVDDTMSTKDVIDKASRTVGDNTIPNDLFEQLRLLRRRLAEERDVPAYIICSDVTLRDLAFKRPTTHQQLLQIHGIGERKAADFGEAFLSAILLYNSQDVPVHDNGG